MKCKSIVLYLCTARLQRRFKGCNLRLVFQDIDPAAPEVGHGKVLIIIAIATLVLEAWMVVEAILLWPKVKGVLEPTLAGGEAGGPAMAAQAAGPDSGMNC